MTTTTTTTMISRVTVNRLKCVYRTYDEWLQVTGNVQDYNRLFQTCTSALTALSSPSSANTCIITAYNDVLTRHHKPIQTYRQQRTINIRKQMKWQQVWLWREQPQKHISRNLCKKVIGPYSWPQALFQLFTEIRNQNLTLAGGFISGQFVKLVNRMNGLMRTYTSSSA